MIGKCSETPEAKCWLLLDNGSLRPEGILFLREVAKSLAARSGEMVYPVSYAHSNRVSPGLLNGHRAETLAERVESEVESGRTSFAIIPFFLSGGGGIMKMVAREATLLQATHPQIEIYRTPFLFDLSRRPENILARVLVERVLEVVDREGWSHASVVVVDHGSPYPEAAMVRNIIGGQVALLLAEDSRIRSVRIASMERREGPLYSFNDPLLVDELANLSNLEQPVVVAQFFLGDGKHAGRDGDISRIIGGVPTLKRCVQTGPMGDHPLLIDQLVKLMQMDQTRLLLQFCQIADRERCPCARRRTDPKTQGKG